MFKFLSRSKPAKVFRIEIEQNDVWQTVPDLTFSTFSAGIGYVKQHYSGYWESARVRVSESKSMIVKE